MAFRDVTVSRTSSRYCSRVCSESTSWSAFSCLLAKSTWSSPNFASARALRTGSASCWYFANSSAKRSCAARGQHRDSAVIKAIRILAGAFVMEGQGVSSFDLLFLGLSQFLLQNENALACLKILCVMLRVVLVEEFLIRLDGLRFTGKFIVTDRADKPGTRLRSFQFGKIVHRPERLGKIFIQKVGVAQIAEPLHGLRI